VNFGASGNGYWPLAGHNGVVGSEVKPIRVVIVDDNPEFLESATRLLEHQGVRIVGLVSTSADAVRHVQEVRPDVTLVDVELGAESGFDVAEALHDIDGQTPAPVVILISTHAESDLADMIEASPAVGFLAKSALSAGAISAAIDHHGDSRPE
jgi:DNA-binding NarL/FixJ family response regulator